MIHKCTCNNEYQDSKYGLKNRVFNPMKDPTKARCTVCKKEVSVSKEDKKDTKSK